MQNRFITPDEINRGKLLGATLEHFNPFPTCEVEILFHTTRDMLKSLNESNPDFETHFNKIVFGSMVIALVIESKKYGVCYYPYPTQQPYNVWTILIRLHDKLFMENFILETGEKVLALELPFDSNDIDKYFPTLAENVPQIKQQIASRSQLSPLIKRSHENLPLQPNDEETFLSIDLKSQTVTLAVHNLPLLFKAIYYTDLATVKKLHQDGMNIHCLIAVPNYNIAIDLVSFAAYLGKDDVLEYLLPLFKLPRHENSLSISPLLWAVLSDNLDTVKIVIQYYQNKQLDIKAALNQEIIYKRGTNSTYTSYSYYILNFALQHNAPGITECLLPFITEYSHESVKYALEAENMLYLKDAITRQQIALKTWLTLIFGSKNFHAQSFMLTLLSSLLAREVVNDTEQSEKINAYFLDHQKLLTNLLQSDALNRAGLELLMKSFIQICGRFSFLEKLYFLRTLLRGNQIEFANNYLKEIYHDLAIMDKSKYGYLLKILLSIYLEELAKETPHKTEIEFTQTELHKVISFDFEAKSELLIDSMKKFLWENIPNKLEKVQHLVDLLNKLDYSDQLTGLIKLYVKSGVIHDHLLLSYFEKQLCERGEFDINHYLKAFAQARCRLDRPLSIDLCIYFLKKIPFSKLFNKPLPCNEYEIYEDYSQETVLTAFIYPLKGIINNKNLSEKYKEAVSTIIKLCLEHYSTLSSLLQQYFVTLVETARNKQLLDLTTEHLVLTKLYALNLCHPKCSHSYNVNQMLLFNPSHAQQTLTDTPNILFLRSYTRNVSVLGV